MKSDPLESLRQRLRVHSMDVRISVGKPSLMIFRDGWFWTTMVASIRQLPKAYAFYYMGTPRAEFTENTLTLLLEECWDYDAPHPRAYYNTAIKVVEQWCRERGIEFILWRAGIAVDGDVELASISTMTINVSQKEARVDRKRFLTYAEALKVAHWILEVSAENEE